MTWRPIETAPHDGTDVLLVNRRGNMAAGLWLDGALGKGWFLRGGNEPNVFFNDHHGPTHWMPLPTLPNQETSGDSRSDFDRGFQEGMRAAYREVQSWSQARLDRLEPGKNQRMRDEIEFAQVSLLHRLRHHLPIQHYPAAWSNEE